MNLHRTSGKPDWDAIAPSKRNFFQKIAASTSGIATPANLITIIGLVIVLYGLWALLSHHYWVGLIMLILGRSLDVVDGIVANATGTKSPVGEIFDAVADKIGTLLTIIALLIAGISDWWIILALILPQVLIPLVIFYKKQQGIAIHPTLQGKLSMATLWIAIPGLIIWEALINPLGLGLFIYVIIAVSIILGFYALWQYGTGRNQEV